MTAHRPAGTKHVDLAHIFETLRDRICLRIYPPGTRLREAELAREFEISRTPVREILQRLQMLGLVEARNGVGTIVRTFSRREIEDIYALRLKVAEMIGELTPNPCTDEHVRVIDTLRIHARGLAASRDLAEYWRINHQVHFLIGTLIGNAPLSDLWDRLYFQIAPVWYGITDTAWEDVSASLADELDAVLAALHENDVAAVGYIQRNFIAFGYRRVTAWLDAADERPDH